MATVIDSLVVLLSLDPAKFTEGQKQAMASLKKTDEEAAKHAKNIEAKAKLATEGFTKMKTEILGMVSAFASATGIASFVTNVTAGNAAVGRLARNIGIATDELSAWERVANKTGSSSEEMDAAFRNVAKIKAEWRTGSSGSAFPFAQLGINNSHLIDQSISVAENMKEILAAAAAAGPQRAMALLGQAGFGEGTANMAQETFGRLEEMLEEQRKAYAVTKKQSEDSARLQAEMSKLADALLKLGQNVLDVFGPTLEQLVKITKTVVEFFSAKIPGAAKSVKDETVGTNQDGHYKGRKGDKDPLQPIYDFFHTDSGRSRSPSLKGRSASGKVSQDGATSAPASPLGGIKYGTKEWADTLEEDLRYGRISPEMFRRITGSGAAASTDAVKTPRLGSTPSTWSKSAGTSATQTVSSEVNIGTVTINTQATDADGIARSLADRLQANYSLTTQANYGLR